LILGGGGVFFGRVWLRLETIAGGMCRLAAGLNRYRYRRVLFRRHFLKERSCSRLF
jgi:hypothetical protein